jgi:hypothetical protein
MLVSDSEYIGVLYLPHALLQHEGRRASRAGDSTEVREAACMGLPVGLMQIAKAPPPVRTNHAGKKSCCFFVVSANYRSALTTAIVRISKITL